MDESQFLSQFKANLNARRISLGLEITDVHQGLLERGFQTAYPTVAGWFNNNRGLRWKVDELMAVLEILQARLEDMKPGEAELVEEPVPAATAREMRKLTPAQQQAVLVMVKTFQQGE